MTDENGSISWKSTRLGPWICPRCYALVAKAHIDDHDRWHDLVTRPGRRET